MTPSNSCVVCEFFRPKRAPEWWTVLGLGAFLYPFLAQWIRGKPEPRAML